MIIRRQLLFLVLVLFSFSSPFGGEGDCPVQHHASHWQVQYRNTTFAVTRLVACRHLAMRIANPGYRESCEQAKERLEGVAVLTGPYFDPPSGTAVDYIQKPNHVISRQKAGRWMLVYEGEGHFEIVEADAELDPSWPAAALGQRLVPYEQDGFSRAFARKHTDRMVVGLKSNPKTGQNDVYIIRAKTDLGLLSEFAEKKLQLEAALNSDGGSVVRGKSPRHIVFLYK